MITEGSRVRLTKLSQQRGGELPVAYWLEGELAAGLAVNHTIQVARTARAKQHEDEVEPVRIAGWYVSSPIVTLTEHEDGSVTAKTQNSEWLIAPVVK